MFCSRKRYFRYYLAELTSPWSQLTPGIADDDLPLNFVDPQLESKTASEGSKTLP